MSEYIAKCTEVIGISGNSIKVPGYIDLTSEIVRCKDCLSWFRSYCHKHVFTITVDGTEYDEGSFPMDANDFCSLGTRREEE